MRFKINVENKFKVLLVGLNLHAATTLIWLKTLWERKSEKSDCNLLTVE
jgi:hypothetical protein